MADAAEQRQLVDLEALPRAAAVAQPAPGQLGLDVLDRHRQPSWQPLDDDDERLPVGLAGRQEAQHAATLLVARGPTRSSDR